MKNKIIMTLILLSSFVSYAQMKITWKDLSKVKFVEKYFPDYEEYFLHPYFSSSVKILDGVKITITGYFLDIDPRGKLFILSKGPMSSCFFCGVGGPETAMELQFSSKPSFKMNDIITVTGILELNDSDLEHFNYILANSKGKIVN
tara:strand:- start:782 stop:1219 length:438 start_codon:yes stop_codon:yes gene_type:complete